MNLNPIEFITIGTIGPKGRRVFHLQAGHDGKIITFIVEKEQARQLSNAINEMIEDVDERLDVQTEVQMSALDMDLREPIEPLFRIARLGLSFDSAEEKIILVVHELSIDDTDANVVQMWCTREQVYALSIQAMDMVDSGRPDPEQNGRILYYWT